MKKPTHYWTDKIYLNKQYLNALGALGALVFLALAFFKLGWVKLALFMIFLSMALQDAITGRINIFVFLPAGILLLIFFPVQLLEIFAPVFAISLVIWFVPLVLQRHGPLRLDPLKTYYGFGDVLGVPLALTISHVFIPVLGLAAFAAGLLLVMPWFARKQQRRFMPWLLPGVLLALITAMVLL